MTIILPTIGPSRSATENNRPKQNNTRRVVETESTQKVARHGFVERRKNPDRRKRLNRTTLDTRRRDRRKTSQIDINV